MAKKNISVALRKRNLRTSENPVVLKKGMELPINTLVVVAIAVIVILAIAAFFMGGFGGSSKDIQNRQAFLNACGSWVQTGCNNDDYNSAIEQAFAVWQPTVDLTSPPTGQSKIDYLASKCGCYGAGTGGRSATCDSYTDQGKTICNGKSGCQWDVISSACKNNNEVITCEEKGGVCFSTCTAPKVDIGGFADYCKKSTGIVANDKCCK